MREVDRISELPRDIKQHILSHLCMREAIATSILSSIWRYTWVTRPIINFGFNFFCQFSYYFDSLPKIHPLKHNLYSTFHGFNDLEIKHIGYVQFLHQLWKIYTKKRKTQPSLEVIKKLFIYVPMCCYAFDVVSLWLSLAVNNVEELSYFIDDGMFDIAKIYHYAPVCCDSKMREYVSDLGLLDRSRVGRAKGLFSTLRNSTCILESKSLTKLGLLGCKLMSENEVEMSICLPFLKQLCLRMVYIDQKLLDAVLGKCRALERLELSLCKGVKVVRVSGLSKLKEVKITRILHLNRVEIDATALQYLILIKLKIDSCKVKVASNSCNNLVELFVNGCGISDDFFNNVGKFPRLKEVTLLDCPRLKRIKIKSSCLTKFHSEDCLNLAQIELDTPKMLFFRYSSNRKNNIVRIVSKFQINYAYLHLQRSSDATFDHFLWHTKLVALLANFSQSTTLRLETNSKENEIIPQELREGFCSPLCGVRNLSLIVATSLTSHGVLYYLDSLLWLSPNPRTISLYGEESELTLELQYEDKTKEGESCGCYPARKINCWRCVLKDFRIVSQTGLGNADSIRKLLESALEKGKATACA